MGEQNKEREVGGGRRGQTRAEYKDKNTRKEKGPRKWEESGQRIREMDKGLILWA